jgi:hypothetical protein
MSDTSNPTIAPTLRLSRRGLIASLAAMVAAGLSVYAMFPASVEGPALPVAVKLDRRPMPTTGGGGAIVTDVVVVENLADHELKRVSIELNGHYLMFQNSPLAAGQNLVLPQAVFTAKRSSHRFDPDRYQIEDIVVTAQLPSGARGVSKFEFSD